MKPVPNALLATAVGLFLLIPTAATAQRAIESYTPVTDDRLVNPEDENWLS